VSSKMQPGITVDSNVWKAFKEKFDANASQEVERLMRMAVESPSTSPSFASLPSAAVNSISLPSAGTWQINYSFNGINISNTTPSPGTTAYSASGMGFTTTSSSNILIDLKGGSDG
jgi:hypothetical protein